MFARFNSRIPSTRFICRLFLFVTLMFGAAWAAQATTFTVTKTADTNDNVCDADCSLREAITAANNNPGKDTIAFAIGSGPQTIMPLSNFFVSETAIIDGTTQPGFAGTPIIEIDGSNVNKNGLRLIGDSITVRGLVINRFTTTAGLELSGTGHHTIVGNFIGTNITGTAAQGNFTGISVISGSNVIGGTTAADRNVISGNSKNSGVGIGGVDSTKNIVMGNYIGTDVTGTVAIRNDIGVYILSDASGNTVGGAAAGARNVISGNFTGIAVGTSGNKVQGNYIGTAADGVTALPNSYAGVNLLNGHDNTIGGTNPGEGNVIALNGTNGNPGFGVRIEKGAMINHNAILGNSIFSNAGLGIDLGDDGVTPNDGADVDTGAQTANENQNYPVIGFLFPNGNTIEIGGNLNSLPDTQFRLEFFSSPTADPTGFGEGKTFLGATMVTTNGVGNANFTFTVPAASIVGTFVTATATDPLNNTSEFSQAKSGSPGVLRFSSATYNVNENGGTAAITVTRTGGTLGPVSVQYGSSNGTATAGLDYTAASGVLNWTDGQSTSKTFTIPITEDTLDEINETVNLSLSNPTGGATLGVANAVLTITDNDAAPTLSINDLSQAEGNAGTSSFTFTATLSAASGQTVTANYATADGTAQAPGDYLSANGLISFAPGETSKPITITVNGDPQSEANETFLVNLSNASNATLGKAQGTGSIVNDDNVPPPTVQFSQASSNVSEDLGALTITVTRSGDTSVATSVDYKTVDGSATQKGDFEYAAGTLKFAAGDTSKTFQVLINEDMFLDGAENFTLALSNPSGATLGGQTTTTVNISDDAPESITNPIDDTQSFVYMQYHDLLNREPDAAGLQFWSDLINSCGSNQGCINDKRVNVSAAFFLSIEFQQTGFLVERAYKATYGNIPGTPVPLTLSEFVIDARAVSQGVIVNQAGWQQKLDANKQAFMTDFVQRARFINAYPTSLTPAQFVDALFTNTGVIPSGAERLAVIARFAGAADTANTAARVSAVLDVAQHSGFVQAETNRAFVLMEYFGYLRRNPNDAPEIGLNFDGYNFWLNKLNSFGGNYIDAEMVRAFITAIEYRQRFGQ